MHLRANGGKLLLFFHCSINPLPLMICGVLSTMMPLWSLTSQFLHWLLGNSVWLSGQSASLRFLRSWVRSRPKTCNRRYSMENSGGHMQHFHLHGRCEYLILLSKTLLEECTYVQRRKLLLSSSFIVTNNSKNLHTQVSYYLTPRSSNVYFFLLEVAGLQYKIP